MRSFYTVVFIILILLAGCQKSQVLQTRFIDSESPWVDSSNQNPKNTALKSLLEKYRKLGLPGISLLVNDSHGTWIGATGKADIGNNIDFVPGTISKVASITKLFMGTLVFKLMEDSVNTGMGYNSLYRKVKEWLPARITDKLPNGNEITLGQCLKHETGLPDLIQEDKFYLAVLNNPNKKWKAEELLEFIYNKTPDFAPGDTAVYSNSNYIIVTMILESQTGKKHADLLKEYILKPLGLTNTFYQPYDQLPGSTAQGYYDLYNNNSIVNVSNLVTGSGNGYGGIYSNIFDLFKFENALFIQKTLLKPSSLAIMQTYGKKDDANYYGYGLQKSYIQPNGDYAIGHKGRDLGYSANLFYFPQKGVTHIFFINYGTDAESKLKDVFRQFVNELITLTLQ